MALTSYLQGEQVPLGPDTINYVHASNNPGLIFIAVIVLLIIFTNAKLRGIYSVLTAAFFVVLFAWLGWWDAPTPSSLTP